MSLRFAAFFRHAASAISATLQPFTLSRSSLYYNLNNYTQDNCGGGKIP